MRNVMVGTKLVEKLASFDAQTSFKRAGRIVHPAVNDAAIVRAGVEAWTRMTLEYTGQQSARGDGSRRRESADASANHGDIDAFHAGSSPGAILPSCDGLPTAVGRPEHHEVGHLIAIEIATSRGNESATRGAPTATLIWNGCP
jgi:hypothetical protein